MRKLKTKDFEFVVLIGVDSPPSLGDSQCGKANDKHFGVRGQILRDRGNSMAVCA